MTGAPESSTRQLDEAAVLAERGFLAAGQSLEAAVAILNRLTQCFADYVAELTGETLAETHRGLATAGAQVEALAEARRLDGAGLDELADIVATADIRIAALAPITQEVAASSLS